MNLKNIRDMALMASDHVPDSTSYHRWLNTLIDTRHRELWDSKLWTFCTKTVDIPVYRDKVSGDWDDAEVIVANGQTAISFTEEVLQAWDAEQPIEINGVEYMISGILSTSTCSLATPYQGPTEQTSDWKIKHRNIYLPKDCVDVTDVSWRNAPIPGAQSTGSLIALQPKAESSANLSLQDQIGKPQYYVQLPDVYVRSPEETLTPTLTLSVDNTPGFLASGTYTFAYSYVLGAEDVDAYGLLPESDPWPRKVEIVVPTSNTNTILFSVFAPQSVYSSSDKPVRIKVYYVNTLYDGRYELIELRAANEQGPLFAGTTGQVLIGADMFTPSPRPIRHPLHGGRVRAIRMWPRPNAVDYTSDQGGDAIDRVELTYVTVTYIARPEHILREGDTPQMPEEFHQVLADQVTADVHLRAQNMTAARLYEKRANDRLPGLINRYGTNRDSVATRGPSWGLVDPLMVRSTALLPTGAMATYRGS